MTPDVTFVMPVNRCSRGYDGQLCEENVVVERNMLFGFFYKSILIRDPWREIAAQVPVLYPRHGISGMRRAMITFIPFEPEIVA